MEPSLAYRSAIVITVMASPFVGCFAATSVRASLTGHSFLSGFSHCRERQRNLVPIFSWFPNRGTCRNCPATVSFVYPAMELAFFAAALWASQLDQSERAVPAVMLGWILIALAAFDLAAFVLPDVLTYSLLVIGLTISLNNGADAALEAIAGVCAGASCLLLAKYAYRLAARRDGLGMGDVKLFAAAGAWVGPEGLPRILLIASLVGLIYAGIFLRGRVKVMALAKVPFGAGLCLALWVTWNFGKLLP